MRSNLDPYATHKQTFLDPSTISPSKDYYYAERAKEGALATIGTSPERERPAKKINPYDCFRPGEARQTTDARVRNMETRLSDDTVAFAAGWASTSPSHHW